MVSTKIRVFRRLGRSNHGGGAISKTSWRSIGRHRRSAAHTARPLYACMCLLCTATGTRATAGSVASKPACFGRHAMDLCMLYFRAIWLNRSIPSNQIRTSTRSTTGSEGRRRRSAASDRLCSAEEEDTRRRDRRKNERRRPAAAVRRSDSILQRRRGEQIILAFGLSMG